MIQIELHPDDAEFFLDEVGTFKHYRKIANETHRTQEDRENMSRRASDSATRMANVLIKAKSIRTV